MMQVWKKCFAGRLFLGAVGLVMLVAGNLPAQAGLDPVEDLRQALVMRPEEKRNPTAAMLQYRRDNLEKRIAALRTISDLRRGLVAWKTDPDRDQTIDRKLQAINEEMRAQLGGRLRQALEKAARAASPDTRLAVANLIAELGPTVGAVDANDFNGYGRSLQSIALGLVDDPDLAVRQEALRALGNINADPKKAVPKFVQVLQTDRQDGPRRLAAGGLLQLLKVVTHLKGQAKTGIYATPADLVDAAERVVRGAGAGLGDPDFQVRALCLEAIQSAAAAYGQTAGAYKKTEFPPQGRPLADAEIKDIKTKYTEVNKLLTDIRPVLKAIAEQGPQLAQALRDPEVRVRRAAINALNDVAHLRLRLLQRVRSLPKLPEAPAPKDEPAFANPLDALGKDLLPGVIRLMADADVDVRRDAVEFVEQLEDDGASAIAALVERLNDHNRFIRWAAARALGNFDPPRVKDAVPALALLIDDPDLDVRLAAIRALEGMGPHARAAVANLTPAILVGDPELRIAVIDALASIGSAHTPGTAVGAIPNLIKSLSYDVAPDPRVRKAAAEVLGKFGPLAQTALPALRDVLGDDDAEVRAAASDAILSILVPAGKE